MSSKPSARVMANILQALLGGELTVPALRQQGRVHSSSIYPALRQLEEDGCIVRKQPRRNQNASFAITPDGVRRMEDVAAPGQRERKQLSAALLLAQCLGYMA